MENMEKFETSGDFGDLITASLLPAFEKVRSELREQAAADLMAQGLLEVAEAITFDRQERRFYQVYTNVPSRPGGPATTVRFPMLPQEVGLLTQQVRNILPSQPHT